MFVENCYIIIIIMSFLSLMCWSRLIKQSLKVNSTLTTFITPKSAPDFMINVLLYDRIEIKIKYIEYEVCLSVLSVLKISDTFTLH